MKKGYFVAAVAGAFLVGYFVGCSDEYAPAAEGAQRYVYEVSEANLTGAGGDVNVPVMHVGHLGNGGANMAQVTAYGSGYGNTDRWRMLVKVELVEGAVHLDSNEYPSYYYRVVVVW